VASGNRNAQTSDAHQMCDPSMLPTCSGQAFSCPSMQAIGNACRSPIATHEIQVNLSKETSPQASAAW